LIEVFGLEYAIVALILQITNYKLQVILTMEQAFGMRVIVDHLHPPGRH
jgi:hypothetical protein